MKRTPAPNGRRHGLRAKTSLVGRNKTVLVFESRAQVYFWTTDRGLLRPAPKH